VRQTNEAIDLAHGPSDVADAGEPSLAFVRLAEEHLNAAYRLARAILHDPAEADDATHDAFVQAWRKWSTLREIGRFEMWFDRILVNICRTRLRARRWATTDISDDVAAASGDPYGQATDRDELGKAIARLSPDHRVVVAMRYYSDLAVEEIANRLGIPAGTVQSRLHYALKRLHEAIDAADTEGMRR
jgi:RNA polymerase sigma-70 factor (ECF subfamily)